MSRSTLTDAQAAKVKKATAGLFLDKKGEQAATVYRFADKWARYVLGVRGTSPSSHTGLSIAQRQTIREAVNAALGIKVAEKVAKPKVAAKPKAGKKGGKGKSTVQLAKEQKARAEQVIGVGSTGSADGE